MNRRSHWTWIVPIALAVALAAGGLTWWLTGPTAVDDRMPTVAEDLRDKPVAVGTVDVEALVGRAGSGLALRSLVGTVDGRAVALLTDSAAGDEHPMQEASVLVGLDLSAGAVLWRLEDPTRSIYLSCHYARTAERLVCLGDTQTLMVGLDGAVVGQVEIGSGSVGGYVPTDDGVAIGTYVDGSRTDESEDYELTYVDAGTAAIRWRQLLLDQVTGARGLMLQEADDHLVVLGPDAPFATVRLIDLATGTVTAEITGWAGADAGGLYYSTFDGGGGSLQRIDGSGETSWGPVDVGRQIGYGQYGYESDLADNAIESSPLLYDAADGSGVVGLDRTTGKPVFTGGSTIGYLLADTGKYLLGGDDYNVDDASTVVIDRQTGARVGLLPPSVLGDRSAVQWSYSTDLLYTLDDEELAGYALVGSQRLWRVPLAEAGFADGMALDDLGSEGFSVTLVSVAGKLVLFNARGFVEMGPAGEALLFQDVMAGVDPDAASEAPTGADPATAAEGVSSSAVPADASTAVGTSPPPSTPPSSPTAPSTPAEQVAQPAPDYAVTPSIKWTLDLKALHAEDVSPLSEYDIRIQSTTDLGDGRVVYALGVNQPAGLRGSVEAFKRHAGARQERGNIVLAVDTATGEILWENGDLTGDSLLDDFSGLQCLPKPADAGVVCNVSNGDELGYVVLDVDTGDVVLDFRTLGDLAANFWLGDPLILEGTDVVVNGVRRINLPTAKVIWDTPAEGGPSEPINAESEYVLAPDWVSGEARYAIIDAASGSRISTLNGDVHMLQNYLFTNGVYGEDQPLQRIDPLGQPIWAGYVGERALALIVGLTGHPSSVLLSDQSSARIVDLENGAEIASLPAPGMLAWQPVLGQFGDALVLSFDDVYRAFSIITGETLWELGPFGDQPGAALALDKNLVLLASGSELAGYTEGESSWRISIEELPRTDAFQRDLDLYGDFVVLTVAENLLVGIG